MIQSYFKWYEHMRFISGYILYSNKNLNGVKMRNIGMETYAFADENLLAY